MSSSDAANRPCPWTKVEGGLRLLVRLTPKAARDAIDGIETLADGRGVLNARVRAVPEHGKANGALLRLLAGRVKVVFLAGDGAALADMLTRLAGGSTRGRRRRPSGGA
jgi:uncharacterized protein YggU (UPF0235/DUF167 family)